MKKFYPKEYYRLFVELYPEYQYQWS
jgi:hypothetical protein